MVSNSDYDQCTCTSCMCIIHTSFIQYITQCPNILKPKIKKNNILKEWGWLLCKFSVIYIFIYWKPWRYEAKLFLYDKTVQYVLMLRYMIVFTDSQQHGISFYLGSDVLGLYRMFVEHIYRIIVTIWSFWECFLLPSSIKGFIWTHMNRPIM